MMKRPTLFLISTLPVLLLGCSSQPTMNELSQGGPTMKQLESGSNNREKGDHSGFKTFDNDIHSQEISQYAERRVPNPELVLINLPRRDKHTGMIIPKYTVRFPMYNKVHYSLYREVDRAVR
jgi:hypothetical protein